MAEMTPMMRQYNEIKAQHPDSLLFFRLGDFYEMFDEDARVASRELDLTLTTRDRGRPKEEQTPMCGVPYHSCQGYIARLIAKGYKVAICDQMEDPALAKGIVQRDVTRVVTPGTVMDSGILTDDKNNYIAGVCAADGAWGLCFCDVSTGEMRATVLSGPNAAEESRSELYGVLPAECILGGAAAGDGELLSFLRERTEARCETGYGDFFAPETAAKALRDQFGDDAPGDLEGAEREALTRAVGGLLGYLRETQRSDLGQLRGLSLYRRSQFMELDMTVRRNLELTRSLRTGDTRGTLLKVMDQTRTAMGHRLLRLNLEKPSIDVDEITRRQDAVSFLIQDGVARGEARRLLGEISDLERLVGRVVFGNANGRDLAALADSCRRLPALRETVRGRQCDILWDFGEKLDCLEDVTELIDRAIVDEPPFSVREGGVIRQGYDAEVDRLNDLLGGGSGVLLEMEKRERERTGIKTLKVSYNKVFGYFIEVSKSYYDQVPPEYVRKQTLVNSERYITQELKELENTMLTARDRVTDLEYQLFCAVQDTVAEQVDRIQRTARDVALLDMLCSFAESAVKHRYCRPVVTTGKEIVIKAGRHPVVEQALKGGRFVPNDTIMDEFTNRVAVITGPNMAGKSTYMRQVALIVLMAQMGSFVPAESACVGVVDRIFTRVGASDDLAGGQSTFMLEMTEVADILKNATANSLIILDEIGRGTSTYDGMSIARAVVEYCADRKKLGAKTLFATHYHELTSLEDELEGVKNYNIAAKKRGDEITFLRRIVRGGADESYGIEVAKLAGVPKPVIRRAKEILASLEAGESGETRTRRAPEDDGQVTLEDVRGEEIARALRDLDPNVLTPIEAMNKLFELKKMAE